MSAEIGLDRRLIDRLRPLPVTYSLDEDGSARLSWGYGDGLNGGDLVFGFADHVDKEGDGVDGKSNIIITSLDTFRYHDRNHNPRESLASILTMVSTINLASITAGQNIRHVVRANEYSKPFFQRFTQSGFYYYSDCCGYPVEVPQKVFNGDWTLFGCTFPIADLDDAIGSFASVSAAEYIADQYLSTRDTFDSLEVLPWYLRLLAKLFR